MDNKKPNRSSKDSGDKKSDRSSKDSGDKKSDRNSKDSGGFGNEDPSISDLAPAEVAETSEPAPADPTSESDHRLKFRKTLTFSEAVEQAALAAASAQHRRPVQFKKTKTFSPAIDEATNAAANDPIQSISAFRPGMVLDVQQFVPQELIKSMRISRVKKRPPRKKSDKPPGPVASKVIYFKEPEPSFEDEDEEELPFDDIPLDEGPDNIPPAPAPRKEEMAVPEPEEPTDTAQPANAHDLPMLYFVHDLDRMLDETNEDKDVDNRLTKLMDKHREEQLKKLKNAAKPKGPNYKFGDMIRTLTKLGIPCPTNEDFTRLHGTHSRWDPDGTVVEYFSPILRTFIPINMRGRYRGTAPNDTCMKGLNISKVPPKRDALEGFVDRGRHVNIQEKYDQMSEVAVDEAHLDYLIEMQAFQAETLPIPIFYDMLHLGIKVANESLRILVQDEGYPPSNPIFKSQLEHAEQLRRKIQLYGALGLETLESKRRGLGEYMPQWLKTRDEILRDVMEAKDNPRFGVAKQKEEEAKQREMMRHRQRERESIFKLGKGDADRKKSTNDVPSLPRRTMPTRNSVPLIKTVGNPMKMKGANRKSGI